MTQEVKAIIRPQRLAQVIEAVEQFVRIRNIHMTDTNTTFRG